MSDEKFLVEFFFEGKITFLNFVKKYILSRFRMSPQTTFLKFRLFYMKVAGISASPLSVIRVFVKRTKNITSNYRIDIGLIPLTCFRFCQILGTK